MAEEKQPERSELVVEEESVDLEPATVADLAQLTIAHLTTTGGLWVEEHRPGGGPLPLAGRLRLDKPGQVQVEVQSEVRRESWDLALNVGPFLRLVLAELAARAVVPGYVSQIELETHGGRYRLHYTVRVWVLEPIATLADVWEHVRGLHEEIQRGPLEVCRIVESYIEIVNHRLSSSGGPPPPPPEPH